MKKLEDILKELEIATRTEKCPLCGFDLDLSEGKHEDLLSCSKCSWCFGMSLGWFDE